jgi:hypothetical protein
MQVIENEQLIIGFNLKETQILKNIMFYNESVPALACLSQGDAKFFEMQKFMTALFDILP